VLLYPHTLIYRTIPLLHCSKSVRCTTRTAGAHGCRSRQDARGCLTVRADKLNEQKGDDGVKPGGGA